MPDPSHNALPSSRRRRFLLAFMSMAIGTCVALVIGEIFVRLVDPQPAMYPRAQFSEAYGLILPPQRTIVSDMPGHYHFEYTTNELGGRGKVVPISNAYPRPMVVILGDSYTFGYGIADGEEYPNLLREKLRDRYGVVNLGMGGWALTQEIRRFYELGQLYLPSAVVLQFTGNDPAENFVYKVTDISEGRFRFNASTSQLGLVKRLLSDSWIQRSQLYNLVRAHLYMALLAHNRVGQNAGPAPAAGEATAWATGPEQEFHAELLDLFARDLKKRNIPLFMIAVEGHLDALPVIRDKVRALDAEGVLTYLDVAKWLEKGEHDLSPEGHWGPATHRTVAEGIAAALLALPAARRAP